MSTLTDVINAAFRESGITPTGGTPDTSESAEALTILINLINSIYQDELGEYFIEYDVGTSGVTYPPDSDYLVSYLVPQNAILNCNLSGPTTLYLPAKPNNGAFFAIKDLGSNFNTYPVTLNGNGRRISGSTSPLVINTQNYAMTWIYSNVGTTGWSPITALAAGSDTFPFNDVYVDMFAIMLAMRINPRYGAQTAPESLQTLKRLQKRFKTQFKQSFEVSSENGLIRLSSNPYTRTFDFTKGR